LFHGPLLNEHAIILNIVRCILCKNSLKLAQFFNYVLNFFSFFVGDFNLEDALHPGDPKPGPPATPRDTDNPKQGPPAHPKDTGKLDDSDLYDGRLPDRGGHGGGSNERKDPSPNDGQTAEASQGAIAGIVSAVFATVIGAVSSFIAYQKKKLCFKQSADEENVNMESHRGAQSEPPVQRTLLEN
uniref:CD99 antigen n=1 Tax=Accipiter nisus TaxID=211598 RepID=A0A8B9RU96_9AVES